MNHYLNIAKEYFQHLEGLQLYPSLKSFWSWAWIFSTGIWLATLVRFVEMDHATRSAGGFVSILAPEAIWLIVTFRINAWKERQIVDATNRRLGTSFKSASECRCHVLTSVMAVPPSEFLKTAKEIDDLVSLQRKFRKYSDLTLSELGRNIYDRDSKARLLALIIALVSMTVALAAKSDTTLETLFDVYSEPGNRGFLLMVAFVVTVAFIVYVGLRIFVLTVVDALASWTIKLFGGSKSWLLAYLIRDLVTYHGKAMVVAPQSSEPLQAAIQSGAEGSMLLLESNVVPIDSSRPLEMIPESKESAPHVDIAADAARRLEASCGT